MVIVTPRRPKILWPYKERVCLPLDLEDWLQSSNLALGDHFSQLGLIGIVMSHFTLFTFAQ